MAANTNRHIAGTRSGNSSGSRSGIRSDAGSGSRSGSQSGISSRSGTRSDAEPGMGRRDLRRRAERPAQVAAVALDDKAESKEVA